MTNSPDMSMLDDLSIDELRWLEASEILHFPTSGVESFQFNDGIVSPFSRHIEGHHWSSNAIGHRVTCSSDVVETTYHGPKTSTSSCTSNPSSLSRESSAPWPSSLPTPSSTPSRSGPQSKLERSSSHWLYRRPKYSNISRGSPGSQSALSSSLTLHQLPSSRSLARTPLSANTTTALATMSNRSIDDSDRRSIDSKGKDPFWSTVLRPRSRSLRSIPLLQTIPSQSEVTVHPPIFRGSRSSNRDASSSSSPTVPPMKFNGMSKRAPSVSSTLSSASSRSSSRPETPVTPSDPFGGLPKDDQLSKGRYEYHRRYASNPSRSFKHAPLPSSCPNRSILARTPSISTKDSAMSPNKCVKFAEIPTVHYASAGYWGISSVDGIDVDDPDKDGGGAFSGVSSLCCRDRPRRYATGSSASPTNSDELQDCANSDLEADTRKTSRGTRSLKRLVRFNTRSSGSPKSPCPSMSDFPSSVPSRPSISGPYTLGSLPLHGIPSSPTHSTTSLRSNLSRAKGAKSFFSFDSSSSNEEQGASLEHYRNTSNPAKRSVRSLGSVKCGPSTPSGLKSWLSRFAPGH